MKTVIEQFDLYQDNKPRRLFYKIGKEFKNSNNKKVIVVHDAQNMFEKNLTAFNMSWEIEKALETLNIEDYIVFGIECKPDMLRIREYSPVDNNPKFLKENLALFNTPFIGKEYLKAIRENLIPFMENKVGFNFKNSYKVLLGSSMGGVITTYEAFDNPDYYDCFLAFSSAFYINSPYIFDFIKSKNRVGKFYFDMGGKESSILNGTEDVYKAGYNNLLEFVDKIKANYMAVFDQEGKHNELAWAKRLPKALKWCFKA